MLNNTRTHKWTYAALVVIVLVALAVRIKWAAGRLTLDDAYITFRYVRNLANGLGFVYNPGEHVLGTTTPLFTMLLALFDRFGTDINVTAKALNVIASTVNVILVFVIAQRRFGEWAALLGTMLMAITVSAVWGASTGMETEFNVLLLLLIAYAFVAGHDVLMSMVAALAIMTRPDDLLIIFVILSWQTLRAIKDRAELKRVLKMLGVLVLCLLPWMVFATVYFGSPIPNSILGKAAASRVSAFDNTVLFLDQFGFSIDTPRALVSTALFLLGIFSIVRRSDDFVIFPAFFVLYSAAFILLGVRLGAGWYWQPLWPAYCIIFAAGIQALGALVQRYARGDLWDRGKRFATLGIALLVILVWLVSLKARFVDNPPPDDYAAPSLEAAGRWLHDNAPANASVGLEPIGAVGWFSDKYIIDYVGLVSPAAIRINARVGVVDFFGNLSTLQPDYYLAWADRGVEIMTSTPDQKAWFYDHYREIKKFGGGAAATFMLFEKVPQ